MEHQLAEQNFQALQGDYVKFVRWAQWRIDKNGEGVIGYIVNNRFLDRYHLSRYATELDEQFQHHLLFQFTWQQQNRRNCS